LNFGTIWKSDWLAAVILTLLLLLTYESAFLPLRYLENLIYDQVSGQSKLAAGEQIILVEMDEQARSDADQQAMATVITQLTDAGARVIGLDVLYSQPTLNSGQSLVKAVQRSGNTLMPMFMSVGSNHENSNAMLPNNLRHLFIKHANDTDVDASPMQAVNLRYPYTQLIQAAAGIGYTNVFGGEDGIVRSEPLVMVYAGKYFPSMSLALAAKALNIPLNDIRINLGIDIELGAHNIATNSNLRMYPTFYTASGDKNFTSYAFRDVLTGRVSAENFSDKIVLIGSAEPSISTPASMMSRNEFTAHVLQSLLTDQYFSRPAWTHLIESGLLVLVGLYLAFLLSRLRLLIALCVSGLILLALISTELIALTSYALWIQTLAAALLLLAGHTLLAFRQAYSSQGREKKSRANLHETNKMLGFSFQSQGMLEQALEKFLTCPVDDEMDAVFYDLAQAFERKRQYKQAAACFELIISHNPLYEDVQARLMQARNSQQSQAGKDSNAALSSLLAGSADSSPTLGRYEIISELGKGAMGTVYLGKDPKINRQVAIKTMALSQEFEPDELEEVKAKFFHEAEIAGMLNHPNIVTIFDAGDEHDLAYIAMEFLDGIDLVPYTKKGKLLPVATTLKIVAKVAEALEYAHANGVIHRDIKPANIMILKNKSVKVTDFGIAHIIETSKKKAGTVLGTPSYMSPEQLSGKELDGRSDLFSMGVMLYELVSGIRPFRGESISKLMFKIAKEPHVDVRQHNADVPDCVSTLIDCLLTKKADLRIENASEVTGRISSCLQELKNQRGG